MNVAGAHFDASGNDVCSSSRAKQQENDSEKGGVAVVQAHFSWGIFRRLFVGTGGGWGGAERRA